VKNEIKDFVDNNRGEMLDKLMALVAIPTVNPPGKSYRRCVDYLSLLLKEWHVPHDVIPVSGGRYPRFCILGGIGQGKKGLHFHGHYDVVPAQSPSQFSPQIRNGCVYGRGSSDMKSGIAVILYCLKFFQEKAKELEGQVSFSFVPDEESGSLLGAGCLDQAELFPRPSFGMVMPEPTSGAVWYANKGALTYRVEIHGKPAHVALEHQGENAFESMIHVVRSLLELKTLVRARKTAMPVNPQGAKRSAMLIGGESGSGVNFNVVPEKAFFTIDRRLNPEEKISEAKKELSQIFDEARSRGIHIKAEVLQEGKSSAADPDSPLAEALKKNIKEVMGTSPSLELCPGVCEIQFFNNRGIPAYAYGPGLLEVSHQRNEYVRIADMLACTEVFIRTALRLLGPHRS
jgi:succinyl-diaminopimelate desuccinylase